MKDNLSSFCSGKVIISGEHSVVYGEPCLASSLDLGIEVIVKKGELREELKKDLYLQRIFSIFEDFSGRKIKEIDLEVDSTLPQRSGLGSSAAFAAAVLKALAKFYKIELSDKELFRLTLQSERMKHYKSSGVDPAIVVKQGLIVYKKMKAKVKIEKLRDFSFQKRLFLINSGEATESTGEMVKKVASFLKKDKKNKEIIKEIGKVTKKIITSIKKDDFEPELFSENQRLLEKLGVVGEKAKKMIKFLEENGAYAKVTGAGGIKEGSGFILAIHENPGKFSRILESQGIEFFPILLGISK